MTFDESVKLFSLFRISYQTLSKFGKEDIKLWSATWSTEFSDIPIDLMMYSARRMIRENKFMPTVAEATDSLRAILIETENRITDDDAAIHINRLPEDEDFRKDYSAILEQFDTPVEFIHEEQMSEEERKFYERLRDILNNHFNPQSLKIGGLRLEA